jgi:hypothetical protein
MSDRAIYGSVRRRTRKELGFPVNLHRLGHASFATTEAHYIMGQSRLAGRALAQIIRDATN